MVRCFLVDTVFAELCSNLAQNRVVPQVTRGFSSKLSVHAHIHKLSPPLDGSRMNHTWIYSCHSVGAAICCLLSFTLGPWYVSLPWETLVSLYALSP